MCSPQPVHVTLPQVLQRIGEHMMCPFVWMVKNLSGPHRTPVLLNVGFVASCSPYSGMSVPCIARTVSIPPESDAVS